MRGEQFLALSSTSTEYSTRLSKKTKKKLSATSTELSVSSFEVKPLIVEVMKKV